jgi:hypothetical protein
MIRHSFVVGCVRRRSQVGRDVDCEMRIAFVTGENGNEE